MELEGRKPSIHLQKLSFFSFSSKSCQLFRTFLLHPYFEFESCTQDITYHAHTKTSVLPVGALCKNLLSVSCVGTHVRCPTFVFGARMRPLNSVQLAFLIEGAVHDEVRCYKHAFGTLNLLVYCYVLHSHFPTHVVRWSVLF